ncbi:MAG: radical SAM protein [Campylobacterota bacterium]|nr:radical SAM protein [Campylobacterota bacterium]
MSIIFGPIHSRRFGKSLGIDLSPGKKQCNFDCLYCELDPAKTMDSYDEVVSVDEVMIALKRALSEHGGVDFITLTANGEPTLYPYLSELIDRIDMIKGEAQTLILSNGSTIDDSRVADALMKIDMVKLSLDCATDRCLHKLDRSHSGITVGSIMDGMLAFRRRYRGPMIIETLFVKKLNERPEEIKALNQFFLELNPSRIDIGTIDRPPAYDVKPLSYEELHRVSLLFDPALPIYIASRKKITSTPEYYSSEAILQTISKRPLTPEDIEILFDEPSQIALKRLISEEKIIVKKTNGVDFYTLA